MTDQTKEVPFIERLGRAARSKASAVGLAVGLAGGVVAPLPPQQPQPPEHSPGISKNVDVANSTNPPKETPQIVMNFTSFLNFTGDEMRAWTDSNLGKEVVILVDTDQLRLHSKLIDADHVQFDLNLANYLQTPPKDGHPVEMRTSTTQHNEFKNRLKLVPQDSKEAHSFPGDLMVTQGTQFTIKIDKLPRGTDSKEAYSEFVLQSFTPPSVEISPKTSEIDFSEWWKLSPAERRVKINALIDKDITFNIDAPNVLWYPISSTKEENTLIFDVSPASIMFNIPTSLEEHPVDTFISSEQYKELQRTWGTETPVDPKGVRYAPALKVPQGTKLKFKGFVNFPDFYLKFQSFTPPPK